MIRILKNFELSFLHIRIRLFIIILRNGRKEQLRKKNNKTEKNEFNMSNAVGILLEGPNHGSRTPMIATPLFSILK